MLLLLNSSHTSTWRRLPGLQPMRSAVGRRVSLCHLAVVMVTDSTHSCSSVLIYLPCNQVCWILRPIDPPWNLLYQKIGRKISRLSYIFGIIIWSRDTRLTILVIFRGWISQDNWSVARDRNNLSVLILNISWICDVIICNLMTLHSYHNTCGNIWKITGQFTQVVFRFESLSMNIQ